MRETPTALKATVYFLGKAISGFSIKATCHPVLMKGNKVREGRPKHLTPNFFPVNLVFLREVGRTG